MSGVREAAVVAPTDGGGASLTAYIVAPHRTVDELDVRNTLRLTLPDYMIPSAIATVEKLPRTANGKLDRRALAARRADPARPRSPGIEARTELEAQILTIWRDLLRRRDVGGHSLLLAQVQSEMQRTLGREWPLVRMLEYPTIAAFAQYLEQGTDEHVTAAATRRSQGRRAALLKRRSAASVARV